MTNYLATATKKTTVAKAKREPVRQTVEGLQHYAAFVAVEKGIAALKESDAAAIKSELEQQFIEAGCDMGRTPENFHGIEGLATASLQLRRKTIKSPLDAMQVRAMAAHKVPVKHIAATFQIAEKYMDDMAILDKLNKALSKAGLPEDLFEQNSEERYVVTDETIDAIFKKGVKVAQKLLPMAAIVTVSTQWNGSFSQALDETYNELDTYEVEAKTIEAKPVAAVTAEPKVQHLPAAQKSVAAAKAKPVQKAVTTVAAAKTVKASKVVPVGALTKAQEKKAVAEGYRPDRVKGSRSATFAKGTWVWANATDGAYVAQIVANGGNTAKVRWIDTQNTAVVDLDQIIPVKVPVVENVAA